MELHRLLATPAGLRAESDVGVLRDAGMQSLRDAIDKAQPSGISALLLSLNGSRAVIGSSESGSDTISMEKSLTAVITRAAEMRVEAAMATQTKVVKKGKKGGKSFKRSKGGRSGGLGESTAKRIRAFDLVFRSLCAATRHESSTVTHVRLEGLPLWGTPVSRIGGDAGRGRGARRRASPKRKSTARGRGGSKGEHSGSDTPLSYVHSLARMLRATPRLMTLELPDTDIGKNRGAFALLLDALRANSSVTAINLSGCSLNDKCGVELCALMKKQGVGRDELRWSLGLRQALDEETEAERTTRDEQCRHFGVVYVDASRNAFGDRTAEELAELLTSDRWLRAINVQGNAIGAKGLALLHDAAEGGPTMARDEEHAVLDCRAQQGAAPRAARDATGAGGGAPALALKDGADGGADGGAESVAAAAAAADASSALPPPPAATRLVILDDTSHAAQLEVAELVLGAWPLSRRAAPRVEWSESADAELLAYPAPPLVDASGALDVGRLAARLDEEYRARRAAEEENQRLRAELASAQSTLISDHDRQTLVDLEETVVELKATIERLERAARADEGGEDEVEVEVAGGDE